MAAGSSSRILRSPSRLVANPTTSPSSTAYPYGGKEVGRVNAVAVASAAGNYRVFSEGDGTANELLEGEHRWIFTCFLRGWDNDALQTMLADGYSVGSVTQHSMFTAPGNKIPGSSALSRAIKLLVVPDDPVNNPGLILYYAIPEMTENAPLSWARSSEFGVPITAECMQDSTGRILAIGRLPDLTIP